MRRTLFTLLVVVAALGASTSAIGATDLAGSKDYPGLTRLHGYLITEYRESRFDSFDFTVTTAGKETKQAVEGHRISYRFDFDSQAGAAQGPMASALEVLRNYQNAVRAAGGSVAYEAGSGGDRITTLHFPKGDKDVWLMVHVVGGGSPYFLEIVEKQAMQQEVTLDAAAMATGLQAAGKVAVPGILFDTGKADLKPESEPALAEIAKLLAQNPTLRAYVVGHTDMVADLDTNVRLSQARAQAVVTALVAHHGVAAGRLLPYGAGPYAPVATNRTEEGRTRNRRVELVEIATR